MPLLMGNSLARGTDGTAGGSRPSITKGELVDDNGADFELCDDNGDILLIED